MSAHRTVTANFTLSLDGRVAGPGGAFDMGWIVPHAITPGAQDHMIRVTKPATTVLLGRTNYQGFGGYWPSVADSPEADPQSREFARWLNETEKVVFSTTLDTADWSNSRVTAEDPAAVVAELRKQPGGDIIIRRLLAADEVDRLSITLCP